MNSNIDIEGNAYFAITPKVCMGGGKLDLRFSAGPIYAYLTAYADFFIVWSPFHFTADMGVAVGGGIKGKVLWWDVDFHIDVYANLHLEGPPFSGYVRVHTFIKDFDICFGDSSSIPRALTLDEFWDLLSKPPGGGQGVSTDGITLGIESGSLPGDNRKVQTKANTQSWVVSPGNFSFTVQCRFALQEVQYEDTKVIPESGSTIDVYSKPMRLTESITSKLNITVTCDTNQDRKSVV